MGRLLESERFRFLCLGLVTMTTTSELKSELVEVGIGVGVIFLLSICLRGVTRKCIAIGEFDLLWFGALLLGWNEGGFCSVMEFFKLPE